ncbi:MAG: hypothetical protein WCC87_16940 [Candidatus Korobacteraceae bacterium]
MRTLGVIGIILLVIGVISFFVPVPTSKTRGAKVGDTSISVTTHHDQKLPPAVGVILCGAGVILFVAGSRKSA